MQAAFRLRNVTLGYDGHPAVHHLTGEIAQGSLTAVIGPNGSGKSTLLKGLAGSIKPLDGEVERFGFKSHNVAYLPQAHDVDRNFPTTVEDLVTMGLWRKRGLFGAIGKQDRHELSHALHAVGLDGFLARPIETLSGGQLQRALFARALLQDTSVILLDEPFNAIDSKTVEDLMAIIQRWHGEKRTVVAVLHDAHIVRGHFPEAILLARQTIAWGKTSDVMQPENLARARSMNEAWDDNAHWCEPEQARA